MATLHTADYSAAFTVSDPPSTNMLAVLPECPKRDELLCHLGALVWAKEFTSVADMQERGIWLPTIRFVRACELKAVKLILADTEYGVQTEKDLARAILEWITLRSALIGADAVLLWLYADWSRRLVHIWHHRAAASAACGRGEIEAAYGAPMAPHMPSGQDTIALYTQWAERAPVIHLLTDATHSQWNRLASVELEPVCELRRYDATQWTNVRVCALAIKTRQLHLVEFAPEDAPLPMGNFIYQIYPARHNKRAFDLPASWQPQQYSIYVYRRGITSPDWIPCVSVRLDAGAWPYFTLPYDATTGVLALFATSQEEADALATQ